MSKILSKVQAEAIAKAMSEMNNIGAVISDIDHSAFDLKVRDGRIAIRGSSDDFSVPVQRENYESQFDFCSAYGLI